jgi:hypothetical protein
MRSKRGDATMDSQFEIRYRDGEYMSGWAGTPELTDLGIANFVSGWGTQVPDGIAKALSNDTGPEKPRAGDTIEFEVEDVQRVLVLIHDAKARREAARAARREQDPLVRCACGHTVPQSQVMSAAFGSCCAKCYDIMDGAR